MVGWVDGSGTVGMVGLPAMRKAIEYTLASPALRNATKTAIL